VQGLVLVLASAWLAPILLVALLVVWAITFYWRYRLGGITGDCLGASVEMTETALLLAVALAMA
jgi:adenosylcobinamide-GDP ribazoletransferase